MTDEERREMMENNNTCVFPKGDWIILTDCANSGIYCSNCSAKIFGQTTIPKKRLSRFCPNCGSKNELFYNPTNKEFKVNEEDKSMKFPQFRYEQYKPKNNEEGKEKENKIMKNISVNLSAPWEIYVKKLEKLFEQDPEVRVTYWPHYPDGRKVTITVDNKDRYEALNAIMPTQKDFGGVKLDIEIIPTNKANEILSRAQLIDKALTSNPLYSHLDIVSPAGTINSFQYLMFNPTVEQIWIDNLGDPHGNISMLAQDLAKDIFGDSDDGTFYCTKDIKEEEYKL